MDNKDLRKVLRNNKEKIVVPDKLKPENIEKLLENVEKDNVVSKDVIKASKRKMPRIAKRTMAVASIAAMLAVILIAVPKIKREMAYNGYYIDVENGFKQLKSFEKLETYLAVKEEEENRIALSEKIDRFFNGTSKSTIKGVTLGGSAQSEPEYSDTNVRTEGINEADIVKTDGEYIYTCYCDILVIIKADGENTELIAEYELSDWVYGVAKEMLLYEGKLIIMGEQGDSTDIIVLDIKDVNSVELLDSFTVEGDYKECRMYDEYLYVFTEYDFEDYCLSELIPRINGEEMDCSHVYLTDNNDYLSYYIMSSYYIDDESKIVDYMSVVNDGDIEAYVSKDNIYLMSKKYEDYSTNTEILKFAYSDGNIKAKATAEVDGELKDVFCIDEYNGYLRLVITSWDIDYVNTLYVFDEELDVIGKIDDIAPGERIYSARFDGDIGYFVTYRQVDPLFSVDLSNPENPKIIGALKIPGFSEYMHMWDEDRMLGIGVEDGEIKLSMFDISNPTNVTEEDKYIIRDSYDNLTLFNNHKAVLVDGEKNIIGFDMECRDYESGEYKFFYGYVIFSYENGEFVEKAKVDFSEADYFYYGIRGIYIGNYIYVVGNDGSVKVIDMQSFDTIKEIDN